MCLFPSTPFSPPAASLPLFSLISCSRGWRNNPAGEGGGSAQGKWRRRRRPRGRGGVLNIKEANCDGSPPRKKRREDEGQEEERVHEIGERSPSLPFSSPFDPGPFFAPFPSHLHWHHSLFPLSSFLPSAPRLLSSSFPLSPWRKSFIVCTQQMRSGGTSVRRDRGTCFGSCAGIFDEKGEIVLLYPLLFSGRYLAVLQRHCNLAGDRPSRLKTLSSYWEGQISSSTSIFSFPFSPGA